jgi:hypothetical protein
MGRRWFGGVDLRMDGWMEGGREGGGMVVE